MRIGEDGNARFIENGNISGSMKPRKVEIQKFKMQIPLLITYSQVFVPTIVKQYDNLEEHATNK